MTGKQADSSQNEYSTSYENYLPLGGKGNKCCKVGTCKLMKEFF